MKTLYRGYCRVEEFICGLFFITIVVLVFGSAFLRLFNRPLIWADDIAKLLFAWTAFLGADVAMRRCRLVGVDILMVRLRPLVQKLVQLLVNLIIIVILVAFAYYGLKLLEKNWERFFQTIPVSYSYVTLSFPVGAMCMILTCLVKIGRLLLHLGDDAYTLVGASQAEEADDPERQVV